MLYFEHKFLYRRIKEDLPDGDYTVPIGKAALRREGSDLSIITYGAMVYTALEAAEELAKDGASTSRCSTCDRSLPLDEEAILETAARRPAR